MKAVFFDRDGTLIIDRHYLHNPLDVEYFEDTMSALKEIQDKGYSLFMVTNQSGIGRGMFSVDQMKSVHQVILKHMKEEDIEFKEIKFCPHAPEDNCSCRKPSPQMINQLCDKYNIDKTQSHMIGDKVIDAECGINAGVSGYLIFTTDQKYKSFSSLSSFANSLA